MRKKNRILSCETVTRGYMIYVQTPNDQLHHRLYSGLFKAAGAFYGAAYGL